MLSFPSSPRDNTAVAGDAPITPPMTPASSDIPTDDAESEDGQPDQRPVIPVQSDAEGTDAYMESDDGSNLAPHSPPRPPLRKLENEQEHIHPYLKLTDFEVKGTLGAFISSHTIFCHISFPFGRYWYLRSCSPCPASHRAQ